MVKFTPSLIVLCAAISGASAFVPAVTNDAASTTALSMKSENKNNFSKALTASIASAILLTSVAAPDAAFAAANNSPDFDFGSDVVLSARSGGRGGGRSSASRMRAPPPSRRSAPPTIQRTTVIQQPATTIIAAPPVVSISPFGYSPFGGMGYGAFGAVNAIGNEIRDSRQENEIAQSRAELSVMKQREAQMEQRMMEMERNQANQGAAINNQQMQIQK